MTRKKKRIDLLRGYKGFNKLLDESGGKVFFFQILRSKVETMLGRARLRKINKAIQYS